ncbi:MAG: SDR family oxidoreductase [Chloroflexota bacterium]|nr:SDR family oxidoreductase [Chloroflexota bacterium]
MRFAGKVAIVTGASNGIGRGIAEAFARDGADVVINFHRDRDGAEQTARSVEAAGRRALILQADVGEERDVLAMFEAIDHAFPTIDFLVNNAGIGLSDGPLHQTSFATWEKVIRTDLHGPFLCSREAARRMVERGTPGRIVNISSVHQESCTFGGGAYCVAKAGLRNLTRTMAIELGQHGITVNDVAPGMIMTRMNQRAMNDPARLAWAEDQIPIKRAGQPADIANMVLFLCSDAGSYCTGGTHYVDGGWMLTWPPV